MKDILKMKQGGEKKRSLSKQTRCVRGYVTKNIENLNDSIERKALEMEISVAGGKFQKSHAATLSSTRGERKVKEGKRRESTDNERIRMTYNKKT